jgi:hypothetical protein
MSTKLQANVYSQEGKEVSKIALPEKVFGVAWNADLVHEVVSLCRVTHVQIPHTPKTEVKYVEEVRNHGSRRELRRARHGSSRSPIWSGGGVAHGPRNERDYHSKDKQEYTCKGTCVCTLTEVLRRKDLSSLMHSRLQHQRLQRHESLSRHDGTMEHLKEIRYKEGECSTHRARRS